jgi:hypothetical protein
MESLDYVTSVRRYRRMPWYRVLPSDPGPLAYGIAAVLRIAVGAGVACAVGASPHSPATAWYAMGLGAAAPVVLEKLTVVIPLVLRTAVNDTLPTPPPPPAGAAVPPADPDRPPELSEQGGN